MAAAESVGGDLRRYLGAVRAHALAVAVITLMVFGSTMFFTFRQEPIYRATTTVVINDASVKGSTPGIQQTTTAETERQVIHSSAVATRVQQDQQLGRSPDDLLEHLAVRVIPGTDVLRVDFDDRDPELAAKLSNAFVTAYIAFRSEGGLLAQLKSTEAAQQGRIDDLQKQAADLDAQLATELDPGARASLASQRDSLLNQLPGLQQRLLDTQASEAQVATSAQIVEAAEVPDSPVSPNKTRNGLLGMAAGLALGVGVALLRDRFDDRIRSRSDLERRVGAPVLASVPRIRSWRAPRDEYLSLLADPKSAVSEAYRALAANLQFTASTDNLKVLLVTSPLARDGKTATAANLAVALAETGRNVVVVSADIRRPRLHRFLGVPNDVGMSSILAAEVSLLTQRLDEALQDPGVPNLLVIAGGPIPAGDQARLLGSGHLGLLLAELRELCDFVIVDAPPVLAVADSAIVAPMCDGVLFVADGSRVTRAAVEHARTQIEAAGGRIVGAVFNRFNPGRQQAAGYYYSEYYEAADDDDAISGEPGGRPTSWGQSIMVTSTGLPSPEGEPGVKPGPMANVDVGTDIDEPVLNGPSGETRSPDPADLPAQD